MAYEYEDHLSTRIVLPSQSSSGTVTCIKPAGEDDRTE